MPQLSPNIDLKLFDKTADKPEKFIDFRDVIAGTGSTSNFSIIDDKFGEVDTALNALKGVGWTDESIMENSLAIAALKEKGVYTALVAGTNTLTATIADFSGTPPANSTIMLVPNSLNTTTVTLSINSETAKPVNKARGKTGTVIYDVLEAKDLRPNVPILVRKTSDGIRYVLVNVGEDYARNVFYDDGGSFTDLQTKIGTIQTDIGTLPSLLTTNKTNLVVAVNENTTQINEIVSTSKSTNVNEISFLNNLKNTSLVYDTTINIVGDSITEGSNALKYAEDGFSAVITKAIQSEIGYKNYGFQSFRDLTAYPTISTYHTLTRSGFPSSFNPNYVGGIVCSDTTIGHYIESTFIGKKARVVFGYRPDGGSYEIFLDTVSQGIVNTSTNAGYFSYFALSNTISASAWGTHVIKIVKLDTSPTDLIGMLYLEESTNQPYVANYGRSSLTLVEIPDDILTFYARSGMVIFALGVNDRLTSTNIATFNAKLETMFSAIDAVDGNAIICDFMFSALDSDPYKTALKQAAQNHPRLVFLDFAKIWFQDDTKNKASKLLDVDGVHPTIEGHEFIANTIMKYMRLPYTKKIINKLDTSLETDWIPVVFQNSWVDFGINYPNASYKRDKNGRVYVRGLVKSGTAVFGTTIFTLPLGFRPPGYKVYATASNGLFGQVGINSTTGNVFFGIGSNADFSLDCISFETI